MTFFCSFQAVRHPYFDRLKIDDETNEKISALQKPDLKNVVMSIIIIIIIINNNNNKIGSGKESELL